MYDVFVLIYLFVFFFFGAVCTVGFHCVVLFATAAILPLLLYHVVLIDQQMLLRSIHLCPYSACTGTLCMLCILFVIRAPTGHEEDSIPQWVAEK